MTLTNTTIKLDLEVLDRREFKISFREFLEHMEKYKIIKDDYVMEVNGEYYYQG